MTGSEQPLTAELDEAPTQFERYLKLKRNRSDHTVRAYRKDIGLFLTHAQRAVVAHLAALDLRHFRAWLSSLDTAGAARSTIARRAASCPDRRAGAPHAVPVAESECLVHNGQ